MIFKSYLSTIHSQISKQQFCLFLFQYSCYVIIIMISLEIAISNFKSYNYQQEPIEQITLKFGQISTTLTLNGGQAGKCLYVDLSPSQLQEIYCNYACGLFIMNRSGKYFSLMSLQKLRIEDKVICNDISFFNDLREAKYSCQFSLVATPYKSPRLANTAKLQQRQNALNMLKKPPIPKQPSLNKDNKPNKAQINSFLYGKTNTFQNTDHLQTLKQDLRKKSQIKSNLQKMRHGPQPIPKAAMSKQPQGWDQDDPFSNDPPMMQFTNQETEVPSPLKVPQLNYIEYQESIERSNNKTKTPKRKQNNFLTFNKNQLAKRPLQNPQITSQFEEAKKQSSKGLPPKRNSLSKQQIKQMAKEQAQSIKTKENVMIPIAQGNSFELVPLSSLKPEQIIDYVQRSRMNEEKAYNQELRKKRLDQREKQIEQKNRRLQQLLLKRQQNTTNTKKTSKEIRTSVHNEQIKQQQDDEQQNEDEYGDDFQSMSASNSIIRSRISSRGNTRNLSKEQQSVVQDQYSQDFDSYSQSMLSKTHQKNQPQSVSDYSESYSISQSYRK